MSRHLLRKGKRAAASRRILVMFMVTWTEGPVMSKTMKAAEFKAKCLDVLDQVAARHETVVVTKRGKPVAQVVPIVRRPKPLV